MTVHLDQADPKFKHSFMTCRACVQTPLDADLVDYRIDTQMMKTPHIILIHLANLDNGINPCVGKLNKEREEIFSEFCTESLKINSFVMSTNYYFVVFIK